MLVGSLGELVTGLVRRLSPFGPAMASDVTRT